jgi:hypothetical protein
MLGAKTSGVDFTRVATIGRQRLHLNFDAFKALLSAFQFQSTDDVIRRVLQEQDRYAEPFFRLLGASDTVSIDASSYEGASVIHDMNTPIGENLRGNFSVVIDGGSLEHIFNFPVAIRNCMEMVRVGGHYLGITPVNNFMGHGFYQFSPELYYRIFSRDNGFVAEKIILFENVPNAQWFQVIDPDSIKKRVELVNSNPTYLLVRAKKIETRPLFAHPPQQSDYVHTWNAEQA